MGHSMSLSLDSIVLGAIIGAAAWLLASIKILNKRAAMAEAELAAKRINENAKREIDNASLDDLISDTNKRLHGRSKKAK